MTTNNAVSLSDKVSELKTSIETIYTLLLSYGDDYVLPQNPETICFNMKARGDHYAYLFLAAEDYIAKARKQINELDRETEKLLEESQNQTA